MEARRSRASCSGPSGYLAPEQIRGERVDARADLFGVGVVLIEALTGRRAFAREHLVETLYAILHEPPPVLDGRDGVPPALEALVMRLLEKSPARRFQSSAELLTALGEAETGAPGVSSATDGTVAPPAVPAPGARRPVAASARPGRATAAVVALSVLAAIAVALTWFGAGPGRRAADIQPVTLAVMPFRSIPAGSGDDLLELGLADVLVSRLGRLTEIRVLPLTATERLRARDDTVAVLRRLGATHLLTGNLQRDGRRVRATVQLLNTADSRTIWSGPIDADASNVFSIQDIIVTRVVGELVPRLAAGTRRALSNPGTRDGKAFEAYLRGRAFVLKSTKAELVRAVESFEQAVKLDAGYADAWAGMASVYKRMPMVFDVPPADAYEQARRAAQEALRIDAQQAEALSALGSVAFWYEWDYPRAERLLRRALDLQPSSAHSQYFLAHRYSNLGRHDEALEGIRGRARSIPTGPCPGPSRGSSCSWRGATTNPWSVWTRSCRPSPGSRPVT